MSVVRRRSGRLSQLCTTASGDANDGTESIPPPPKRSRGLKAPVSNDVVEEVGVKKSRKGRGGAAATAAVAAPAAALATVEEVQGKRTRSVVKSTARSKTAAKAGEEGSVEQNTTKAKPKAKAKKVAVKKAVETLPRKYEERHLAAGDCSFVFGIDEAGRGPLAGPVVAASCHIPSGVLIEGINDSKKIKTLEEREELFTRLVNTAGVLYATCIIDHTRIDEINILEATKEAMVRCGNELVVLGKERYEQADRLPAIRATVTAAARGASSRMRRKVVERKDEEEKGEEAGTDTRTRTRDPETGDDMGEGGDVAGFRPLGLVDGNFVPVGLTSAAECIIGGDGVEYCIGAASIIAKVTRDRIMLAYDEQFPQYNFKAHKGYGTAAHRAAIGRFGMCDIHRRSFKLKSSSL